MTETDYIAPTAKERALTRAIEFAIAHGVEGPIRVRDFGIQGLVDGHLTHAVYVNSSHVVYVTFDHWGNERTAVGEVEWIHDEADEGRDPCDHCECPNCGEPSADCTCTPNTPFVDVHLPGDAPTQEADRAR